MLKTTVRRGTRKTDCHNGSVRGSPGAPLMGRGPRSSCRVPVLSALIIALLCGTAATDDTNNSSPYVDYYDGSGILFRAAHIEGQGIPQIQSITPVELFPYLISNESMIFGDLRFYPTNSLTLGGNAGFGYRYYSESLDRVFGASAWYDGDNSRNVLFQQAGLSFESYARALDLRSNLYLPVGPITRQTSLTLVNGSTRFQGDNLVYDQYRSWYTAMKGFDAEVGVPLPGDFAQDQGIRLYGGGYHFVDNEGDSITGASARLIANVISGLDAQLQITYDPHFQTRAFFGVSWTFGALHRSEMKQTTAYGRMGEHVTRNYTVVAESHGQDEHLTAIDPATGTPYTFAHVSSSAAPGGTGTASSPFQTIAAAEATGRNIVFVQAGSVFNGGPSVVLNPGQRVLGDGPGAQYFIRVSELGMVTLPHGPTSGAFPILDASTGDAVVLASNSQFSGFSITNPAGNGIVGTGLSNVTVSNVRINLDHTGNDGIQLNDITGPVSIANATVVMPTAVGLGALGSGIDIQGGSGSIQFLGNTTVSGFSAGPSVLIDHLGAAGSVTFDDLGIGQRQGVGFEIQNHSAGTVNVTGVASISNASGSTAAALDINNSSVNSNFNQVNVTGATVAAGAGAVNLQTDTGTTSFGTLNIGSPTGTALMAHNAGTLNINPVVNNMVNLTHGGTISAADGTAVDLQSTALNINLTSVSSNHVTLPGTGTGISLIGTTGLFGVMGNGAAGTGGTIRNAATGIFLQNAGRTGFQWMTINANGVGIESQHVGSLAVLSSTISNSTHFGIDALDTKTVDIANSIFFGNGTVAGDANIRAQFDAIDSYSYSITASQFTSAISDNVLVKVIPGGETSTLNFLAGGDSFTNTASGGTGVRLIWNGALSATVDQSIFATSGGSNTGLFVTNASPTALSTVVFTNNNFTSTSAAGLDTAFNLATSGPSQVFLSNNLVKFNSANGTGFEMSLAASSNVNIASNTFVDTVGGATGILFDSVTGPALVTINDNLMNLKNAAGDRGIIFSSVTSPPITLSGTLDNVINNATTPFFVPIGTTTGEILVNGSPAP